MTDCMPSVILTSTKEKEGLLKSDKSNLIETEQLLFALTTEIRDFRLCIALRHMLLTKVNDEIIVNRDKYQAPKLVVSDAEIEEHELSEKDLKVVTMLWATHLDEIIFAVLSSDMAKTVRRWRVGRARSQLSASGVSCWMWIQDNTFTDAAEEQVSDLTAKVRNMKFLHEKGWTASRFWQDLKGMNDKIESIKKGEELPVRELVRLFCNTVKRRQSLHSSCYNN